MMKEEIINFKNQGKTIIFSSHRMEHIENLVFDYYEKKYDYDFDRNVYFNINERKKCFDGL